MVWPNSEDPLYVLIITHIHRHTEGTMLKGNANRLTHTHTQINFSFMPGTMMKSV